GRPGPARSARRCRATLSLHPEVVTVMPSQEGRDLPSGLKHEGTKATETHEGPSTVGALAAGTDVRVHGGRIGAGTRSGHSTPSCFLVPRVLRSSPCPTTPALPPPFPAGPLERCLAAPGRRISRRHFRPDR